MISLVHYYSRFEPISLVFFRRWLLLLVLVVWSFPTLLLSIIIVFLSVVPRGHGRQQLVVGLRIYDRAVMGEHVAYNLVVAHSPALTVLARTQWLSRLVRALRALPDV